MNKDDVKTLFVREDKTEEEISDEIDDTILNKSYDKAVRSANVEIAKRIAMSTNTKQKSAKKIQTESSDIVVSDSTETEWKVGMPCRTIYTDDGEEYEAVIMRIIDDEECLVKYIGYNNSEIVPLSSLKPSHGKMSRLQQMEASEDPAVARVPGEWMTVDQSPEPEPMEVNSPSPSGKSPPKKKHSKTKHMKHHTLNFGGLPQLPNLPHLDMSMLKNLGSEMPLPPPPVTMCSSGDSEEQAISTMLLSWYMTGYYTGLYQGMKRERENSKH